MELRVPVEFRRFFNYDRYVSELEQSGKFLMTKSGIIQIILSKEIPVIANKIKECLVTKNWSWLEVYERLQRK